MTRTALLLGTALACAAWVVQPAAAEDQHDQHHAAQPHMSHASPGMHMQTHAAPTHNYPAHMPMMHQGQYGGAVEDREQHAVEHRHAAPATGYYGQEGEETHDRNAETHDHNGESQDHNAEVHDHNAVGHGGHQQVWSHGFDTHAYHRNITAQHHFHAGNYVRPQGWYYRRWSYGETLPSFFWTQNYWIGDYADFGLMPPPPGYVWVRYGDDAILIDTDTGEIVQVDYGLFD